MVGGLKHMIFIAIGMTPSNMKEQDRKMLLVSLGYILNVESECNLVRDEVARQPQCDVPYRDILMPCFYMVIPCLFVAVLMHIHTSQVLDE